MAARPVGAAAEQRHPPPARQPAHLGERGPGRGAPEAREVSPAVAGPAERAAAERPEKREDGAQLPEPEIHPVLSDAARPETHDEHSDAVTRRRRVVDTPGIRQFELWDVIPEEVEGYFPEFRPLVALCTYPDCTHTHEERCAVKKAAARKQISRQRYLS